MITKMTKKSRNMLKFFKIESMRNVRWILKQLENVPRNAFLEIAMKAIKMSNIYRGITKKEKRDEPIKNWIKAVKVNYVCLLTYSVCSFSLSISWSSTGKKKVANCFKPKVFSRRKFKDKSSVNESSLFQLGNVISYLNFGNVSEKMARKGTEWGMSI